MRIGVAVWELYIEVVVRYFVGRRGLKCRSMVRVSLFFIGRMARERRMTSCGVCDCGVGVFVVG